MSWGAGYALDGNAREAVAFHHYYYNSGIIGRGYWMGHPIGKCPMDLLMYAEVLHTVRPDVLIETGTNAGGSALFFAHTMDAIGHGVVVSLDPLPRDDGKLRPVHPRIEYVPLSSLDAHAIPTIRRAITRWGLAPDLVSIMVVLDAVHAADFVLRELTTYAPMVTPGSYLVVEDTNLNGHPIAPTHGPGPMEAVDMFLRSDRGRGFVVDRSCERHGLTMAPGGWLRKA